MAATDFERCLAFTLEHEGGKADDPRDPGGRTNQGVTQRTFDTWLKARGEASRDVFGMTPVERDGIYRSGYWTAVKGDALGPGVDLAVFDFAVNSGPATALKAWAGRSASDGAAIVRTVCARRLTFLRALRAFATFGRGWTARVAACEALGVKMAEHARIGLEPAAPVAPQVASTLRAEGSAAAIEAARGRRAGKATVAAGVAAHPVVAATTPLPWPLIGASALIVATLAVWVLWRAYAAQKRATAFTSAAAPL